MSQAPTWRHDAAEAYLGTLQAQGLCLEVRDGCLLLPGNPTRSEVELVRLLKPELLALLEEDAEDLRQERAAILEYEGGISREEAEAHAGLPPPGAAA